MTRQKRSHLLILALVPAVVFAAVRCADNAAPSAVAPAAPIAATPATAARMAKLHEATDWIGKYHNEALAYVYTALSHLPIKARDKHTVCETARRAYAEFHLSRRGAAVPASVDAQLEGYCSGGSAASVRAALVSAPKTPLRAETSLEAQAMMDDLSTAVDASTSFEDLDSRVSSIENEAAATLSYDDASQVFMVASITRSSATYWANNLTDWVPFTSTADYNALLTTRIIPAGGGVSPAFNNGDDSGGGFSWSDFANKVWNDTKAAAKRAAKGDVKAAVKSVLGSGLADAPVIYDIVIASAAAGSIGAVLQI